jgi:hypothetical protein
MTKSYGPNGSVGFFVEQACAKFLKVYRSTMIEEYDALIIRCPQLGGEVPFKYCRTLNEDFPCRKIMVCWEFRIEISKFLGEHYSIDQIQCALAPPTKTRLDTILDIIEKAKKINEEAE